MLPWWPDNGVSLRGSVRRPWVLWAYRRRDIRKCVPSIMASKKQRSGRQETTCLGKRGKWWIVVFECSVQFYYYLIPADVIWCLRDWSWSGGSYGNNTQVICCPVTGRPHRHRTTNHEGVVAVTPNQPWSIPITTWLNNFVWNLFTAKYVQNLLQIERRRRLASIVTSRISP